MDDKQEFKSVLEAMWRLGIDGDDASGMLGIVAAILHLGNVEFVDNGSDGSQVADTDASLAGRSLRYFFTVVNMQVSDAFTVLPWYAWSQCIGI